MGKSSQRKGRRAEFEVRDILIAGGWEAEANGIWEPFDIKWEGRDCEVKRRKDGMGMAYTAFDDGAGAYFFRADRKPWLITHTLDDFIERYGDLEETIRVKEALIQRANRRYRDALTEIEMLKQQIARLNAERE